jgi:tryptophan 2,3-dioxygenase
VSESSVHWDLGQSLSSSQDLHLDKLLGAQQPLSNHHDEALFIAAHQVQELWMKLCLHELAAALECIRRDDLGPSFKMLSRITRIQAQMLDSWDVLATMTPFDYSSFRNNLGKASGFQSYQYRMFEFLLGNKNPEFVKVFEREPQLLEQVTRALRAPSLYDECLRLLSRRGYDIPRDYVDRDWSQE